MAKQNLIILTGPTAVGKTALSIGLAKKLDTEIISADSMQVYKYMDIGSAKITKEEMCGVKHHLVDVYEPTEEYNVVKFKKDAKAACEEIYAKNKTPLIVGGTGFYIQALIKDVDFSENEDEEALLVRAKYENLLKEKGVDFLFEELKKIDPDSCETIHKNNTKRVIRALEYYELNKEPISVHNKREQEKEPPYNAAYFVLNDKRELLYERIDKRVDQMFEAGLIAEVKRLYEMGLTRSFVSMQGLGYKEVLDYLNGILTLEECKNTIKEETRHFAKRQLTWFRREKDVIMINKDEFNYEDEKILAYMYEVLRERGIVNE